jgi:hypothetical protein
MVIEYLCSLFSLLGLGLVNRRGIVQYIQLKLFPQRPDQKGWVEVWSCLLGQL